MGATTLARFTPDVALIHFHDALEEFALLKHCIANPHSHVPSGVLIHFQIAGKLAGRESLLGVQD